MIIITSNKSLKYGKKVSCIVIKNGINVLPLLINLIYLTDYVYAIIFIFSIYACS